jgi:hypothetical protein
LLLQITKRKAVAIDDFAALDGDWAAEDGASEDEGVEFAVFATGVNACGKIGEKIGSEFATGEAAIELLGVDADGDGAEPLLAESASEFARVALPDWKDGVHGEAGEVAFAVLAQVFEEDVAKGYGADACGKLRAESVLHTGFVNGIDALRRDADFFEGQAESFGLLEQQCSADAMHADAVVVFGHGGEETDDADVGALAECIEGESAVFATAPAKQDGTGQVRLW